MTAETLAVYRLGEERAEHLSFHRVGSSRSAGSEPPVSSCRRTATGISCSYDHRETLWRIKRIEKGGRENGGRGSQWSVL